MKLQAPPRRQYYKWLCNTGMAVSHTEPWVTRRTRGLLWSDIDWPYYTRLSMLWVLHKIGFTLCWSDQVNIIRSSSLSQLHSGAPPAVCLSIFYLTITKRREQICKHLTYYSLYCTALQKYIQCNVKTSLLMFSPELSLTVSPLQSVLFLFFSSYLIS